MKIIDYNGMGKWSQQEIQERYSAYCVAFGWPSAILPIREHVGPNTKWIYPVLDEVIKQIELGDLACIALGVDLIEEDEGMPFGRRLKSNTARALRRSLLSEKQKGRLRKRIVFMLIAGNMPREFREYAKLLRHIGVADLWPELHAHVPRDNRYAMHFYKVLSDTDASFQKLPTD